MVIKIFKQTEYWKSYEIFGLNGKSVRKSQKHFANRTKKAILQCTVKASIFQRNSSAAAAASAFINFREKLRLFRALN